MECFERGRCFLEFGSILDKTFIPPQDVAGEPPTGPRTTQDNLQWAIYGVLCRRTLQENPPVQHRTICSGQFMECFERGRCFLEFGSILDITFIPPQDVAGEPPRTTQDNLQWAVYGVL